MSDLFSYLLGFPFSSFWDLIDSRKGEVERDRRGEEGLRRGRGEEIRIGGVVKRGKRGGEERRSGGLRRRG